VEEGKVRYRDSHIHESIAARVKRWGGVPGNTGSNSSKIPAIVVLSKANQRVTGRDATEGGDQEKEALRIRRRRSDPGLWESYYGGWGANSQEKGDIYQKNECRTHVSERRKHAQRGNGQKGVNERWQIGT